MKRLIIALLSLSPIFVNAQSFWSVVDDDIYHNISHKTDKGLFQDSIILVSGFVSDASCHYHNLFAYNKKGLKLWNIGGFHDVIYTDANYIYTAGYTPIDDVIGYEQIKISKYNKNGDEIFSIGYPDKPHDLYFPFEPKNIEIAADGTILVSSDTSIVKSNISGAEIREYTVKLESPIKAIHSINPVSYLLHTQNKVYKSDSSLILVDSVEFTNSIIKLVVKNDTIYTLLNSCLLRMDTSLNVIDTIVTSEIEYKNMELYQNKLWVQFIQSDSLKLINLQSFENPDTVTYPILVNDIEFIVSEDQFFFLGNSFTNQIGIYSFQSGNAEIVKAMLPDIEIIDFNIDSIVIDYYHFQGDSFATGFRFDTELTVKNNSNNTIHSFAVFSDLNGGFNCNQNYFYQKFSGLEILPGQTQNVKLNRAYEEWIGKNKQLCFQCLAPNSNLEISTENNSLCKTFTITGIKSENISTIKAYPNPVKDYLTIENSEMNFKSIEIFNIRGEILIRSVVNGKSSRIDTSNLPSGLYILKITSDVKAITQMIIKE